MKITEGEGGPQPSSHWMVQRETTTQVKAGDTMGISDSPENARPCHVRGDKSRQLVFPNHTKAHKCPSLWGKRQGEHGDGREHRQRRNVQFLLERKIFPSLLCTSLFSKNSPDFSFRFDQKLPAVQYHWRLLNFHQRPNRKHLVAYLKVNQLIKSAFACFRLPEAWLFLFFFFSDFFNNFLVL